MTAPANPPFDWGGFAIAVLGRLERIGDNLDSGAPPSRATSETRQLAGPDEPFDQITFGIELLAVLRQIRDELRTVSDVLSELVPDHRNGEADDSPPGTARQDSPAGRLIVGSPTAEAHHATEAAVRLACDRCRMTMSGDDIRPALAAIWTTRHTHPCAGILQTKCEPRLAPEIPAYELMSRSGEEP